MLRVTHPLLVTVMAGLLVAACTTGASPSTGATSAPSLQPVGTPVPTATTPLGAETPAPTETATATQIATAEPTSTPGTPAPPTPTPTPTPTAAPTEAPTEAPTATPVETQPPIGPEECTSGAWVGFFGYGVTCLSKTGWHTYDKESGLIRSNQVHDIASCPDGRTWIATTLGLAVTDGQRWDDLTPLVEGRSLSAVACDGDGGVWVAYYGGAGHIVGDNATWYEATELGTGEFVKQVNDIAVGPDGRAWAVTANSVAAFDGTKWTYWEEGRGFKQRSFFEGIAVDGNGNPWVGYGNGVYTLAGGSWKNLASGNLSQVQAVAVDTHDRVWAGTYSRGVSVWNGKAWTTFNRAGDELSSDHVRAIAVDAAGRVWLGTEWGLDVFDGRGWTSYQMHTSGLADNDVYAVAVVAKGPPLPALETKRNGALSGTILQSGEPVDGATVEICTEYVGFIYMGKTPCTGQPIVKSAVTGSDGRFVVKAVPVGRYVITLKTPAGKWLRVTDQFRIGVSKATVAEGATTDMGELNLAGT